MSDFQKLQDNLINNLAPDSPNSTGWRACYCPICNTTTRKTAGIYTDDNSVGFQCFRASCSANCGYELGKPISRRFKALCNALSVKIPVSLSMVKNSFQKALEALDDSLYKKHVYKEEKLDKAWQLLEETNNTKWKDYYQSRCVPLDDIYLINSGVYKGLTAIAMKYYEKIIGWQVVDPDGHVKYRTLSSNEHCVAINGGYPDNPIIIVEGILDQASLPNTCAITRSRMSPEQAYQIRGRKAIMLPDRSGNDFIKQAKDYDFSVCVPPWEENDVNAAVQRYGVMVVCKMIVDNTYDNINKAEVAYNLWRKR